ICPRVSYPKLEPADGAGADAGKHDAGFPRAPKQSRKAPLTPDRQHALRVAASDADHVLREKDRAQIWGSTEERHMARPTSISGEGRVEACDVCICVSACRGQKADRRI